jgi:hypothetical protein
MYFIQRLFSGVPKRSMPQVMPKTYGLNQVLIKTQCPGNSPSNLRYLQSVRETGSVMISLRAQKDLTFVFEAAERFAVENAVPIPLKAGPQLTLFLRLCPSPAFCT